jgi:magnesium transporter
MAEQLQQEKTARHLERLSAALDSGVKNRARSMLSGLSAAEIGDLLESMPLAKRLALWELVGRGQRRSPYQPDPRHDPGGTGRRCR